MSQDGAGKMSLTRLLLKERAEVKRDQVNPRVVQRLTSISEPVTLTVNVGSGFLSPIWGVERVQVRLQVYA